MPGIISGLPQGLAPYLSPQVDGDDGDDGDDGEGDGDDGDYDDSDYDYILLLRVSTLQCFHSRVSRTPTFSNTMVSSSTSSQSP